MASKPNPNWSATQQGKAKNIQEATEVAIPYFGPEIPRLDNHTREQVCDDLGVLKDARKTFEKAEKALAERFKALLGDDTELRTSRFEATYVGSTRTALDQGKAKELIEAADNVGLDLDMLLRSLRGDIDATSFMVPDGMELTGEKTNANAFNSSTSVKTLNVKPI